MPSCVSLRCKPEVRSPCRVRLSYTRISGKGECLIQSPAEYNRWDVLDLTGYPSTGGLSSVVSAWVMTCAAVWPLDERGDHQQRLIQGMSRPRRWQRSSAA